MQQEYKKCMMEEIDTNTEIKINEDSKITQAMENITIPNQYRLECENIFNIFSKFILLFIVFTFMSVAFLSEYSALNSVTFNRSWK